MFAKRKSGEKSYYWHLMNNWREELRNSEDGETLDTKKRKIGLDDECVAAENNDALPSASPDLDEESPKEIVSRVGQTMKRENNKYV